MIKPEIEHYYVLNVERFYRDYYENKRQIKKLESERNAAIYQGGIDYSSTRVSGGMPGDPTATRAAERMKYDAKIQALEDYLVLEEDIYDLLTEEERVIVDCWKNGKNAYYIADKINYSVAQARVKMTRLKDKVRGIVKELTE